MLGKKAENLKILLDKGFNVPQFIVISLSDIIDGKEQFNTIINDYYNLPNEENFEVIKKYLNGLKIDIDIPYEADLFSVRSSCSIEDGDNDSFAGQFDSYLNIKRADIYKNVIKCFLSMINGNVIEYIKLKKINIDKIEFNVIIQKMINADFSGVLFTSNPQGIINESVIVCGEGIGENIVLDKIDTTTYYYNTTDDVYYYDGKKNILNNLLVVELINLSKKIIKVLGKYLDIEFAIKDSIIYLLQARKITTINDDNMLIMDNSNIVESYPGISLPLTISFVEYIYTEIFKNLCGRILKDKKELQKRDDIFKNMVGSFNGRIYYKISNWYEVINCLPFSKRIIPIWQEMLGIKEKTFNDSIYKLAAFKKAKTYFNFFYEYLSTPSKMKKLEKKFEKVYSEFKTHDINNESKEDIIKLYNSIAGEIFCVWDITLLNDLYTFINTGVVKHRLKRKFKKYEEITNQLISCNSNIESIKPIRSLINLAYEKDNFSEEEFKKKKEEYIEKYGDRNVEELKLESKTFRTNPKILDEKLLEYSSDKNKLEKLYKDINKEREMPNINIGFWNRHFLGNCRRGIKNREISRLNRSRIFGMVRSMFLRIGEILKKEGKIDSIEDVFYLKTEELFGDDSNTDFKELINKRKEEFDLYKKLPQYNRIIFTGKEFNKHHTSVNNEEVKPSENELIGTACSNGKVTGEALVIKNINDLKNVGDKILVTKMTDPGWVFYLAMCKGIVSEKGSLLSHTAIISRELHVPAVVGVKDCTSILKNGDIIEIDGDNGTVRILERKSNDKNN